jgi:glycosyltransferase involved in cell wall biosynthesis
LSAPLVTVITVTYNSVRYVRDAIDSVLAQNYGNIEYIIGDDCSTDDSWAIIATYKDERIKAYRNPTNIGEYANRNKALGMATGKYLLFIDGDDMVHPHGLTYMVTMLDAFPDSAIAIVGYACNHFIYPLEFTPEQIYKFQFFGKGFLSYSMVGNLFRSSVLKEQGGFPTQFHFGDYYLRLKMSRRNKCLIIGGEPVWARATPGQASSLIGTQKGYVEVLLLNRDFIMDKDSPLSEQDRRQALYNVFQPVAKVIVKQLLTLRWSRAGSLMKALGWSLTDLRKFFWAKPAHGYMSEHNSTNLLKMDSASNPFSRQFRQGDPAINKDPSINIHR